MVQAKRPVQMPTRWRGTQRGCRLSHPVSAQVKAGRYLPPAGLQLLCNSELVLVTTLPNGVNSH